MASPTDWRALAQQKREAILEAIPKQWRIPQSVIDNAPADLTGPFIHQFLTPSEIQITETPAPGILEKTTTGQWTALSVAEAFSHRAALAHQLTSCLTEVLFGPALADARRLDAHFATYGKPVGPLHGLPVSLKDSVDVAGAGTSLGFTSWAGGGHPPASQDAVIAGALRRQGAVFHAKTAVPQASFAGETFGAVSGYVANPLRRDAFSSGGSSGGEAALLALRGSVLGLGTDIGEFLALQCRFYAERRSTWEYCCVVPVTCLSECRIFPGHETGQTMFCLTSLHPTFPFRSNFST